MIFDLALKLSRKWEGGADLSRGQRTAPPSLFYRGVSFMSRPEFLLKVVVWVALVDVIGRAMR